MNISTSEIGYCLILLLSTDFWKYLLLTSAGLRTFLMLTSITLRDVTFLRIVLFNVPAVKASYVTSDAILPFTVIA